MRRFVIALVLAGCSGAQPVPRPGGTATCVDVCANMRVLACEEARPTNEGASCEAVCMNVQMSNVIAWNLDCRAHVDACAKLDACER